LLLTRKFAYVKHDGLAMLMSCSDLASLFFMTPMIAHIIGQDGNPKPFNPLDVANQSIFPNCDKHDMSSLYRGLATNIYGTRDGRYYHLHGSLNPSISLNALDLPAQDDEVTDFDVGVARIQERVGNFAAEEIDNLMNEKHRQAGCIPLSKEEYFSSPSGKANHYAGLYELTRVDEGLPPSWWPEHLSKPSSARRPLAGLKVLDLSRIIAGPSITRSLAEMGASVMRVTGPGVPDLSAVHHDLNWGKWNSCLDLNNPQDQEKLWDLIKEADVVVDGYRPGVLEKRGFGRDSVFEAVRGRGRGIIYVRENCYGWKGPWVHRSGWQQISDACCGISMGFGRAMGLDEPVTPVFPNADFWYVNIPFSYRLTLRGWLILKTLLMHSSSCSTGVIGCVGTLHALILRAENGGSFGVDVSRNRASCSNQNRTLT
jgi:hypothetical protein